MLSLALFFQHSSSCLSAQKRVLEEWTCYEYCADFCYDVQRLYVCLWYFLVVPTFVQATTIGLVLPEPVSTATPACFMQAARVPDTRILQHRPTTPLRHSHILHTAAWTACGLHSTRTARRTVHVEPLYAGHIRKDVSVVKVQAYKRWDFSDEGLSILMQAMRFLRYSIVLVQAMRV